MAATVGYFVVSSNYVAGDKVFNQRVLLAIYGSETWTCAQVTGEETSKCPERNGKLMLGISLIDIKKWYWAGHICRKRGDRWTQKVTDRDRGNTRRSRPRPMTGRRDEITKSGDRNWKQGT